MSYRIDGEVHADGQLVLDSLIDLLLHLVAQVLVLVGRTKHLVDLAVLTVQFLFIVRRALGFTCVTLLGLSPK